MKRGVKTKRSAARRRLAIERWTVERLDADAGMARVESVPMRPEHVCDRTLAALNSSGLEAGMDRLALWDGRRVRIRRLTIGGLVKRLGLRGGEKEKLCENMVFWVVRARGKKGRDKVFHATVAARRISKQLYHKVARVEGGAS